MSDIPAGAEIQDCTGVILAGGTSRRMGQDKAALSIGGEPLLARVVRRLRSAVPEVLVVGPSRLEELVPGVRVVPDQTLGQGPLGGLATGLGVVRTARAFVIACDMPFVAPPLVRAMVRLATAQPDVDALLLRTPEAEQYLHAVYAQSSLEGVLAQLAAGDHSLRALVSRLRVHSLSLEEALECDPAGLSWFNANTLDQWARALSLAAPEADRAGC